MGYSVNSSHSPRPTLHILSNSLSIHCRRPRQMHALVYSSSFFSPIVYFISKFWSTRHCLILCLSVHAWNQTDLKLICDSVSESLFLSWVWSWIISTSSRNHGLKDSLSWPKERTERSILLWPRRVLIFFGSFWGLIYKKLDHFTWIWKFWNKSLSISFESRGLVLNALLSIKQRERCRCLLARDV